jgi:hypothetical protein
MQQAARRCQVLELLARAPSHLNPMYQGFASLHVKEVELLRIHI